MLYMNPRFIYTLVQLEIQRDIDILLLQQQQNNNVNNNNELNRLNILYNHINYLLLQNNTNNNNTINNNLVDKDLVHAMIYNKTHPYTYITINTNNSTTNTSEQQEEIYIQQQLEYYYQQYPLLLSTILTDLYQTLYWDPITYEFYNNYTTYITQIDIEPLLLNTYHTLKLTYNVINLHPTSLPLATIPRENNYNLPFINNITLFQNDIILRLINNLNLNQYINNNNNNNNQLIFNNLSQWLTFIPTNNTNSQV
eukprot:UN02493